MVVGITWANYHVKLNGKLNLLSLNLKLHHILLIIYKVEWGLEGGEQRRGG